MTHPTRRDLLRTTVAGAALGGLGALLPARLGAADGEASAVPAAGRKPPPVGKKGVCGGIRGEAGLAALTAKWFYSWGSTTALTPPPGVQWVPQIFPHVAEDIAASCARVKAEGHDVLLGFNEPDHRGQGDMTVEQAVAAWPTLMQTGLRLVSPAVTWATNGWMREFMKQADERAFRIDAVGVHWYGAPDPKAFLTFVREAHRRYGHPIWVTEFGVCDKRATAERPSRITPGHVVAFLKEVLPELEASDWIERYCLYGPHRSTNVTMGSSVLFDERGGLSEVGAYVASV